MALVAEKNTEAKLVIPGANTSATLKLIELARKLEMADRVIFTGPITQASLWRLYENAAVYIFTSPKEDLGIVVQEAQATGTPVVAWKAGGPTVTVVDKKTGFLVKPFDKRKMAERVLSLLNNPKVRDKMGYQAWEHVKNNFSWERHIDILEKEFKKSP